VTEFREHNQLDQRYRDMMRKRILNLRFKYLLSGILMVAACSPVTQELDPTPLNSNESQASIESLVTTIPTTSDANIEETNMSKPLHSGDEIPTEAEALVELAKQRLVAKYGFILDEIALLSVTPRVWPDSSLGCPRNDQAYAQIITPGFQILFQHGVTVYTFHTDLSEQVILCQERPPDDIFIQP
jgi:hypothetical protein